MIDEIDRKLILELQKDGRCSYSVLARRLRTSVSTVSRRIERLLRDNIIVITAVPDPASVGYLAFAMIALDVELERTDDVCAVLAAHPSVYFTGLALGRFDILTCVHFPSSEMLFDFVKNELPRIDGVRQVETFYIVESKKQPLFFLREDALRQEAPQLARKRRNSQSSSERQY